MALSRIVMRLARNPGTEFAGGDDHRGYTLVAPLDADGQLDAQAFAANAAACTVHRFAPDEDPVDGKLARRGQQWFFDYGEEDDVGDEPVYRLGDHRFAVGEYVTVTDEDARPLTYKVVEVHRRLSGSLERGPPQPPTLASPEPSPWCAGPRYGRPSIGSRRPR